MSINVKRLQEENKMLKDQIVSLQNEVVLLKAKSRPSSSRVNKTPDSFNKSNNFNTKSKFEESSIERHASKESSSHLINTEVEILKEMRSSSKKKGKNREVDFEGKSIIDELILLKEENKYLKTQLQRRNIATPRSESRIKRNDISEFDGNKNTRGKHCKVCAKLLSKGYTTRFCPTHGHSFRVSSNSYLS